MRAATLAIVANAVGVIAFLAGRSNRLLAAVVDPVHPDWPGMERAFAGFTLYAVSLLAVLGIGLLVATRFVVRRARAARPRLSERPPRVVIPAALLAGTLTALVVIVFIEVLLFQDYGIHLYEFDVFTILADAALRRDLGIQPAEVLRVTVAAITLLVAELLLCAVAFRVARWRNGAAARACAAAMVIAVPGGFAIFRASERGITSDRAEFEGALPFGRQLLLRETSRPHIALRPRLGAGGYATLDSNTAAPVIADKRNIVFFVADGLRGDMIRAELTPNLMRFAARRDVIRPRLTFSTGHVSEAGIFGLLYGVNGQAFFPFMERRVPAYPIELLKRNGYHTFFLASSRLNPYPSDQLLRMFDEVAYPRNDDEALAELTRYVAARRADKRPYFVLAFIYTPHYPFTSAKQGIRRYPMVGPSARTNYMNDVLQADDYFRQVFDLVQPDYEQGRTALLATADHGEEIRDHGVFGHASATFWNEKIVVPFMLGLPGRTAPRRAPALTSHVDLWPTLFDYLGVAPRPDPRRYSDGRSLFDTSSGDTHPYIAGRFFPYADRPSALVDDTRKYWFHVPAVDSSGALCIQISRVTDLDDRPAAAVGDRLDPREIPAFAHLQATFWRFVQPTASPRGCTVN